MNDDCRYRSARSRLNPLTRLFIENNLSGKTIRDVHVAEEDIFIFLNDGTSIVTKKCQVWQDQTAYMLRPLGKYENNDLQLDVEVIVERENYERV